VRKIFYSIFFLAININLHALNNIFSFLDNYSDFKNSNFLFLYSFDKSDNSNIGVLNSYFIYPEFKEKFGDLYPIEKIENLDYDSDSKSLCENHKGKDWILTSTIQKNNDYKIKLTLHNCKKNIIQAQEDLNFKDNEICEKIEKNYGKENEFNSYIKDNCPNLIYTLKNEKLRKDFLYNLAASKSEENYNMLSEYLIKTGKADFCKDISFSNNKSFKRLAFLCLQYGFKGDYASYNKFIQNMISFNFPETTDFLIEKLKSKDSGDNKYIYKSIPLYLSKIEDKKAIPYLEYSLSENEDLEKADLLYSLITLGATQYIDMALDEIKNSESIYDRTILRLAKSINSSGDKRIDEIFQRYSCKYLEYMAEKKDLKDFKCPSGFSCNENYFANLEFTELRDLIIDLSEIKSKVISACLISCAKFIINIQDPMHCENKEECERKTCKIKKEALNKILATFEEIKYLKGIEEIKQDLSVSKDKTCSYSYNFHPQ